MDYSRKTGRSLIIMTMVVALTGVLCWSSDFGRVGGNRLAPPPSLGHSQDFLNWSARSEIVVMPISGAGYTVTSLSDGNQSTGIGAALPTVHALDIRIRGQIRPVNRIVVYHSGSLAFDLSGEDLSGRSVDFAGAVQTRREEGNLIRTEISFTALRTQHLRLTLTGAVEDESAGLYELSVGFRGDDTDDGLDECGSWWVEKYHESDCGGVNAYGCSEIARDVCERLDEDYTYYWEYDYGNDNAWEDDFRKNNNDLIDDIDLVMVAGKGNHGKFHFSNNHGGCALASHEVDDHIWGNKDMEWMLMHAGEIMEKKEYRDNWHQAMDGMHLMCSWETQCRSLESMGSQLEARLIDQAKRVYVAWLGAARASHEDKDGSKTYSAFTIGEAKTAYDDYLWEIGYVSEDSGKNSEYWICADTFQGNKSQPTAYEMLDLVPLEAGGDAMYGVKVPRGLPLDAKEAMPEQSVSNRIVDASYVDGLADLLCTHGISSLCSLTTSDVIYYPDSRMYGLHGGADEIYVWEESGAWEYVQSETWLDPPETLPTLMDGSSVVGAADALLSAIGWLPEDGVGFGPSGTIMGVSYDEGVSPDSTFLINTRAGYERQISGYDVIGPGAYMEVTFGNDDSLQSIWCGGWRDVTSGIDLECLTLGEVLDEFAVFGASCAVGGLPRCDTFLVSSAELGYWEHHADTAIDRLMPVWLIDGACVYTVPESLTVDTTVWTLVMPALSGACGCCRGIRGNVDGDPLDVVNISDMTYLVTYLFSFGAEPPCFEEGDVTADGTINISDMTYLVGYLFSGGEAPPDCR